MFLSKCVHSNKKGFALIFTLSTMALIVLVGCVIFTIGSNDLRTASSAADSVRAYYMAEAGIARKFMEIRTGASTSSLSTTTLQLATGRSGTYSVAVSTPATGAYLLTSTGRYGSARRTITMTIMKTSASQYAYLSNSEDMLTWSGRHSTSNPIYFITGDIMRGPVHTNDQLNISGDPVFEGAVSSSASSINYLHGGPPNDNPDFEGSLALNSSSIAMPSSTDINAMASAAQTSGIYLTGDTKIVLNSSGALTVTNYNQNPDWVNKTVSIPSNKTIYVNNGVVSVSGTLNGQLTIAANYDIKVTKSILYSSDPIDNPASTDLLGLVSKSNVYIGSTAADTSGNVEVDAYILVPSGSFTVEDYSSALHGTLTIVGGVTQATRGPVGTFNSYTGDRISGYEKDYYYDTRMGRGKGAGALMPPSFPYLKDSSGNFVYVKSSWRES